MNFFLLRSGNQMGPFPMSTLSAMHQSGQVLPTDYIWVQGAPSWVLVSDYVMPGAKPAAPPPPLPATPTPSSTPIRQASANVVGPPPLPQSAAPSYDAETTKMIQEVEAGGRFVIFTYCISVLIL